MAIGIDRLVAAAVDVLGIREFANDQGHQLLVRWVMEQAQPGRIGMRRVLHYGAAMARMLLGEGKMSGSLPSSPERRRRPKGKSDLVDPVAIARVAAAEETLASARRAVSLWAQASPRLT